VRDLLSSSGGRSFSSGIPIPKQWALATEALLLEGPTNSSPVVIPNPRVFRGVRDLLSSSGGWSFSSGVNDAARWALAPEGMLFYLRYNFRG